ncbi:MAG TPA: oligosaccharide flippase family protein, partial [Patescibacteria group bacterium]|nr:oligosaccharide flippase family protein [Patescibacteria group bacterium]
MDSLKARLKRLLLWSQKYTRTDMVYLARGGFWVTLNSVIAALVSLALAVAFANLLPKETYGTYRFVLSIAGAFGFLALTGMNAAVTRSVARGHDGALPYAVRAQLRWNLLYTAVMAAGGAYYLARHGAVTLGVSLLVLGVLLPPSWAFATFSAFIAGKKDFKRGTQYSVLGTLLYFATMLAAILFGRTALWLVVAYGVGMCAVYALLYALTLRRYRPEAIDAAERVEMERYGKHLSLVNVLSMVAQQVDNIVVFKLIGPAELAVYAFANLMPERLKQFAKSGMGVIVPRLAEKDLKDVVKSLRLRCLQSLAVGTLLALLYIAVVPFVFRYLFPQYGTSVPYS